MFRLVAIACLLASCVGSSSTGIDTSTITCPPDSTLTYESFGQLVIEDNCLSCHASKTSPHLVTVEAIRQNRSAIMNDVVASTKMPKGGDMVLDERQMLGEWLACGAP